MPLIPSFLRPVGSRRRPPAKDDRSLPTSWWGLPGTEVARRLDSSHAGLSPHEAAERLRTYGPNSIEESTRASAFWLLVAQFRSPLVLILVFAAGISLVAGEWSDATIVLIVVLGSTLLGFFQEYSASTAVARLRAQVTVKASVLRDGVPASVDAAGIVPGDVVLLSAGSLVPADGLVLESKDCFVNQAVLTGETFPVEKHVDCVGSGAALSERTNCVFMGTNVTSGTARMLVVDTGRTTVFGSIAERLVLRPEETEFERGVRRFGTLLTQVMLVMVVAVLAINILLDKPKIDSLLFALALAVGLAPELLPAIISITLAQGARRMAARGVIVRRLAAIENLGSMDVLCTDKTGTLTEGTVQLADALDVAGRPSDHVLRHAFVNARLQSGMHNALDDAICAYARARAIPEVEAKVDEVPYDFVRKRLSIVASGPDGRTRLVTKGALEPVLSVCTMFVSESSAGSPLRLDDRARSAITDRFSAWSEQGFRVLGVATRDTTPDETSFSRAEESDLTFVGFLRFLDPPKPDARDVIADLATRGVALKIITGDNRRVAAHVAEAVGLSIEGVISGHDLEGMGDEALWHLAERTTVFAEVDPNQKERIILALRKTGHVVGYMGDGINDAPALHAADVGISVDSAVDVAKGAADFVLLRQSLRVLREGIDEGRVTFANTLKYILTTISANFGNMFSMAGASLFLPFLPLLAPQILLNNFLSDIPGATIAGDNVDAEWVTRPRRWDTGFLRDYMITFGLVSSIFDFATFGILLHVFHAAPEEFRTGWFIESLLTELVIALVVRTRQPFFRSRPGAMLLWTTVVFAVLTVVIPYIPAARIFGFVPIPGDLLAAVGGLTVLYVIAAEIAKWRFYRRRDASMATR